MASTIKVDEIKEKTVGSGITLGHALKNSSGTEIMSATGVFSSNIDGGTIQNATLDTSNKIESLVGMIAAFAMSSPPTGWLACQGQTLDADTDTAYNPLWNAIGTTWGGTGKSSFVLPDLRGAFLRGTGDQPLVSSGGSGEKASGSKFTGQSVGSFENDQFQGFQVGGESSGTRYGVVYGGNQETATSTVGNNNFGYPSYNLYFSGYSNMLTAVNDDTNGNPRKGDETRPFNAGVLYCIRWK